MSEDKIISRRNRLIEYQKISEVRFTPLYDIIDENISAINYLLYENKKIKEQIKKVKEFINTPKELDKSLAYSVIVSNILKILEDEE